MSLEDLIKNNKKSTRGGRGGRGSGPGPARRLPTRAGNRAAPYPTGKPAPAPDTLWQHDLYSTQVAAAAFPASRASSIETGTKLYISNLDYGVSNEDIKELFSEIGDLKRYGINYDRSGRSRGTAEVVFSRRADAVAAVKRYNNVQLDGKLMKIEIVGTNIVTPAAPTAPLPGAGIFANPSSVPKSMPARDRRAGPAGTGRSGGGRGRGRGGRGRGRGKSDPVSAEDLDADLEKYHSEAMQTN